MLTEPFLQAKAIIEKIEKNGYRAFFVGGSVRDLLLERIIGDIDIATSAAPQKIQEMFPDVIPIGIKHGTVIVRFKHQSYEVTTFRVDGDYSDQRHPDTVEFIQTIDQDLRRRDFTINALAMDLNGNIIDLFDGKSDIQNKIIRTVGDGHERFTEDPLRIIRALRFSSQLGFSIDQETLRNMTRLRRHIKTIAVERILNEITKLFAGEHVHSAIKYLNVTGVHQYFPIMIEYPYILNLIPAKLQSLKSFGEVIALLHYLEPKISIATWVKEWKGAKKTKSEAQSIADALFYYKKYGIDEWFVYCLPSAYIKGFVRLVTSLFENHTITNEMIQQIKEQLPIHSKKDMVVDGNDLGQWYPDLKKGPWMQWYLNCIEKQLILGKLNNNKQEIKEWITWNPPEIS